MNLVNLFFTNIAYANIDEFIGNANRVIVNPLIYLLFALAFAFFLYGVLEFLMNQENEEKRTAGKNHMIYGIIGITIMFGIWGILNILLNTFGIKNIDPQKGQVELNTYNPKYPKVGN